MTQDVLDRPVPDDLLIAEHALIQAADGSVQAVFGGRDVLKEGVLFFG